MNGTNKRKKRFILLALLIFAGLLTYLILTTSVFVVRNARVEGTFTGAQDDIIRAAKLPFGQKMHAVNEDEIRMELESGGLYQLVGVDKAYPSTVILHVRERAKDAVIMLAGNILTLEKDGTVVAAEKEMPEGNAVYVTGLDISTYSLGKIVSASGNRLNAMEAALTAIQNQEAQEYVSELNVENVYALHLYSRTGIRVELGDAQNMERKIAWMLSAVKDLEARGETGGTLDVSSGDKADYSA